MAREVVDSALAVHRELGPGLLESVYERCLAYELTQRGVGVERQKKLPLAYRGLRFEAGYLLDLLVGERIVVELKAVERIEPVHEAQLLSNFRLSGLHLGFLINLNVRLIKEGIRRFVL